MLQRYTVKKIHLSRSRSVVSRDTRIIVGISYDLFDQMEDIDNVF